MLFLWVLRIDDMIGRVNTDNEASMREENMLITFTWSCTNFLAPKTNG